MQCLKPKVLSIKRQIQRLADDDITRALTQVTDAKNGLNGEAKLATEKQNAKDAVNAMTHLNDAQNKH